MGILHIQRFLMTSMITLNGEMRERNSGASHGEVISSVLDNLFMQYSFVIWMERKFPNNSWVRNADE
jgi:retron-type reverse transcriptase